jgi:choline-sulfatase
MTIDTNLLVIMADEFSSKIIGAYGNSIVQTPNIDRLALTGTLFKSAYTPSPICCPARAAFHTGLLPHQTGYWDNCIAYDGRISGWQHRLKETSHPVNSIGKLHFRKDSDPIGFDERIAPLHLHERNTPFTMFGDIQGLIRNNIPYRTACRKLADTVGPGNTQYVKYDNEITKKTCQWLQRQKSDKNPKPWVLFTSFACPHFPLTPPKKYFDLYSSEEFTLPKKRTANLGSKNEWWHSFRQYYPFDDFFENDEQRRIALASYFALCSFVDDNVGKVVEALQESGLAQNTRILFTSDHGDNLGARGLWGKSNMYEESASIPLIMSGADIPSGKVVQTPVSLIDVYPTVLDCVGEDPYAGNLDRDGTSLFEIIERPDDQSRTIFSEYHAAGSRSAQFMLRRGRYKYIKYVGYGIELFDLETDPEEKHDLSESKSYKGLIYEFETHLKGITDPQETDNRAKKDQALMIEAYGGIETVRNIDGIVGSPAPV